jgi:hypothetical protein
MADQSKVLVRLQLLGRQAFKADAREAAADVRGIGRATDNVNRSMGVTHGVSSAAAASLGLIARGAGAGAIGIGLLAGAAGKMGLSFDSTMEQNTVSFSHFLGHDAVSVPRRRCRKQAATRIRVSLPRHD